MQGAITELEPAEGCQMGAQRLPKIQAGEQLGAGMGEGVGAAAVEQGLAGLGIAELHLPAAAGQGQGRQGAGGPSSEHTSPQRGS